MPNWLKTTRQGTLRTFALAVVLEASLLGQRYNFQVYGQEQGPQQSGCLEPDAGPHRVHLGGHARTDFSATTATPSPPTNGLTASQPAALRPCMNPPTARCGWERRWAWRACRAAALLPVKLPDKAEDVRGPEWASGPTRTARCTSPPAKGWWWAVPTDPGFTWCRTRPKWAGRIPEGLLTDRSAPGTVWFGCGGRVCLYSNGKVRSFGPAEGGARGRVGRLPARPRRDTLGPWPEQSGPL